MQLKETGSGEVTSSLAEILVTLGATGEGEEAAQRKERETTNHNTRKRHLAILTVVLSIWLHYMAS